MNTLNRLTSIVLWSCGTATAAISLAPTSSAQYCINPKTYCTAKTTSQGTTPRIGSIGAPEIVTNNFCITLSGAIGNVSAIVISSPNDHIQPPPFQGGLLCVAPPLSRSPMLTTSASGTLQYQVPLDVTLGGAERHFQVWFRDSAQTNGLGIGLSDALSTHFALHSVGVPPPAPSALVNHIVGQDAVQLDWTDNADNETKYRVAKLDPGEDPNNAMDWDNVGGDLPPNTRSFTVSGLAAGGFYQFKVRCGNDCDYSDYSNTTQATAPCPPLPAPSNLMFSQYCSKQIRLDWTDNSSNELTFRIARLDPGEDPGDPQAWDHVGTVGANVTTFTDTSVQDGLVYQYKVRAYDGCGYSNYSDAASAWTICVPVAPWNCVATRQGSTPQPDPILVTWDHTGLCVAGFRIARLSPGMDPNNEAHWTGVGLVSGNQFHFVDNTPGLIHGQTFLYKVRCQLATNCGPYFSDYSNIDPANP